MSSSSFGRLEGTQVESELLRRGEQMVESEEGTRAMALELCREFEDSFILYMDSGESGGWRVISSFEGTLPNRFKQLPLNDLFDLNSIKKVVLEADGYQPYLLSPENGLRELVRRALELAKDPGKNCVDQVHHVLVDIVAAAAAATSGLGRYPLFKRQIVSIASSALDDYRSEAKRMVSNLVDMERSYIPPQHFNRLAQRRLDRQRREEEQKIRASRKAQDAEQNLLNRATSPQINQSSQASNLKTLKADKDKDNQPTTQTTVSTGDISGVYLLKKRVKKSGWAKRWFVLNEKTNRLGYTKTPDERLFRGIINLEECVIEDVSDDGDDSSSTKSSSKKGNAPDLSASLAFKISNKVPYKTVLKAHSSIILKAETSTEKQEWMSKLRNCTQQTQQNAKSSSATAATATTTATTNSSKASDGSTKGSSLYDDGPVIRRPSDPDEDLRMMGQEIRDYVEAVLNSLSANIPKAVVLCQVERSKDAMLNKLYNSISMHSVAQLAEMLQEDPEVKRRRRKQLEAARDNNGAAASSTSNEEWRVAFDSAKASNTMMMNGRIENGEEIGSSSSRRTTPSRVPPAPPSSLYSSR